MQILRYKELDIKILLIALTISIFGVLMIFSAGHSGPKEDDRLWISQLIRLAIAIVGMLITLIIDYRVWRSSSYLLYGFGLALLLLVLLIPESTVRRWFLRGAIQPSELARIILIITLARYLSDKADSINGHLRVFVVSGLMVSAYTLLIFLQPSLGYALTLIPIALVMFYMGRIKETYLLFLIIFIAVSVIATIIILNKGWNLESKQKILVLTAIYIGLTVMAYYLISKTRIREGKKWVKLISSAVLAGILLALVGSMVLKDYQKARLIAFIDPDSDPAGSGYHIIQSKIAIGSGRLLGQGYLRGAQNRLDFLPAQHTDFIFSVAAEEWGFVGALVLLSLYFALITNGLKIAARADEPFGTLLATGITAMIMTQVFLNIGVTLGLVPVTGLPLPLMSYGGSSLFTTFMSIGLLLNIKSKS